MQRQDHSQAHEILRLYTVVSINLCSTITNDPNHDSGSSIELLRTQIDPENLVSIRLKSTIIWQNIIMPILDLSIYTRIVVMEENWWRSKTILQEKMMSYLC